MRLDRLLLLGILLIILITGAQAIPAAPTVSQVGSNNVTFSSTGATAPAWFVWGVNQQNPEWLTPNQTPSGGAYTAYVYGSPYLPNINYYVEACDATGCSANAQFTSLQTTPIPQTTFGAAYNNITQNGFNIIFVIQAIPQPYLWEFPVAQWGMALALVVGLIIAFYFLGLFLQQRKITLVMILGMMTLSFFLISSAGFGWGLPPEMVGLGEMLLCACLTGAILSLFKKG